MTGAGLAPLLPAIDQTYQVMGHLASGGQPIHVQLDEVLSGWTTADQTFRKLGEFKSGRATAGWDSMEFFPLLDAAGKTARIRDLAGQKTLRVTMLADSDQDLDYFMFIPVAPAVATISSIKASGSNFIIAWTNGRLEMAQRILGPWTAVPNAKSLQTIPISGSQNFFRVGTEEPSDEL